ncbi:uncharacterized protein CLUP02_17997 [Colletotrichum lupini]|uniref:Uncharacterized protein n=1 Tax=Colletotrichum lupini TaxID=145971 RepID=A0A9Q8SFS1_9PEZI|nr:uncharacterized protein CLUP02_17997 [Colletotrichum lupini]UQC76484.1 hypothetical protein CLUP02_17997 [Colletotrichum lupini]
MAPNTYYNKVEYCPSSIEAPVKAARSETLDWVQPALLLTPGDSKGTTKGGKGGSPQPSYWHTGHTRDPVQKPTASLTRPA